MYCFFTKFTDVTELMYESQYYKDGECRNKNCLKGRGGNDWYNKKTGKENTKDIRHGGSGHDMP